MKFKYSFTVLFLATTWCIQSQRVSQKVGSNPTIINPTAVLELESTNSGFLPPRMNFNNANTIFNPAVGLVVWCLDCGINGELIVFNGSKWTTSLGNNISPRFSKVPTSTGGFLTFMSHNLGADFTADPLTPSWRLNGAYFQWGKKPIDNNGDRYVSKPNSGIEGFVAAPSGPAANQANSGAVTSWSAIMAPNGSWNVTEASPVKTTSDPCPNGYRVPTRNEWVSINITANWTNLGGSSWIGGNSSYTAGKLISSTLFLPAAGIRQFVDGTLILRNSHGFYWSSTEGSDSNNGRPLTFDSSAATMSQDQRHNALSVRCVAQY
jgi:uncharacterized protein (TIGR02145 family)